MDSLIVRQAELADIPAMQSIMARASLTLGEGFYAPEQRTAAATYLAVPDPVIIADGTFAVIEIDGEVVATGGWSRRRKLFTGSPDQESLTGWLDPQTEPARIRSFFVHPNWARRGLARKLYAWAEAHARAAGFSRLSLMATRPGVPLYSALGFHTVGDEDILLPDGTRLPCVRMSRAI
jgi:GNAT superfamily N-acetyltransferase